MLLAPIRVNFKELSDTNDTKVYKRIRTVRVIIGLTHQTRLLNSYTLLQKYLKWTNLGLVHFKRAIHQAMNLFVNNSSKSSRVLFRKLKNYASIYTFINLISF